MYSLDYSPLVHKDEFAIDGVARDVFSGLHANVPVSGLRHYVGMQATDCHQAAEIAAFVVGLAVLIQAHLGGRPALQVARAVDGAEAFAVGCGGQGKETLKKMSISFITEQNSRPTLIQEMQYGKNQSIKNKLLPFFLEQVEGKSLSSIFTRGLLHFILQKKERRAPEHSLDGPGVMSVFTGSPAERGTQHTHTELHRNTGFRKVQPRTAALEN